MLVSSLSGVAESLFATLFPSDCRLCGTPLVNISRLPVCLPCLSEIHAIAGGVCSVCGERVFSPACWPNAAEIALRFVPPAGATVCQSGRIWQL